MIDTEIKGYSQLEWSSQLFATNEVLLNFAALRIQCITRIQQARTKVERIKLLTRKLSSVKAPTSTKRTDSCMACVLATDSGTAVSKADVDIEALQQRLSAMDSSMEKQSSFLRSCWR